MPSYNSVKVTPQFCMNVRQFKDNMKEQKKLTNNPQKEEKLKSVINSLEYTENKCKYAKEDSTLELTDQEIEAIKFADIHNQLFRKDLLQEHLDSLSQKNSRILGDPDRGILKEERPFSGNPSDKIIKRK